ncbi:MAG: hypothetical protein MJY57_05365, partial [Bacteroidales bacterium]|nr:hypothetical protein [Bacteroidales bacterium]
GLVNGCPEGAGWSEAEDFQGRQLSPPKSVAARGLVNGCPEGAGWSEAEDFGGEQLTALV